MWWFASVVSFQRGEQVVRDAVMSICTAAVSTHICKHTSQHLFVLFVTSRPPPPHSYVSYVYRISCDSVHGLCISLAVVSARAWNVVHSLTDLHVATSSLWTFAIVSVIDSKIIQPEATFCLSVETTFAQ